jgi:hypothetical protein
MEMNIHGDFLQNQARYRYGQAYRRIFMQMASWSRRKCTLGCNNYDVLQNAKRGPRTCTINFCKRCFQYFDPFPEYLAVEFPKSANVT